ncbi:Kinesin light chain 2 [Fusarium oxysporum f. sp. raphani]|uniref:Kinesin light chain 2 n=1 Tax=Fusarium oxysporum f. sp. raphani TaxID=96318 RepID=A0A8J5UH04_FUSOX|nr:Kinesin light chain 2 [Fusarium oxysporum f. sp. raphani]
MTGYLNLLRHNPELYAEYPGVTYDRLFEASYCHSEDQKSCEQVGCDGKLVPRRRLQATGPSPAPAIHFGLMASGDSVMKSGEDPRPRSRAICCSYGAACTKAFLDFWVSSLDQDISGLDPNFQNNLSLQSRDSSEQNYSTRAVDGRHMKTAFIGLLFQEGRRKAALVGLGGIGKTQIALQLAYQIKEKKQDYSVFWVPALSRASFEQACMQIMDACGIPTTGNSNAVESVRQHLSSKDAGKWLLVVDNADDVQTVMGSKGADNGLYRSLPQSDHGRILFTTRYRKVAVSVAGRNILEVPAMGQDEARSYFKEALIQEMSSADDEVMNHLLTVLTHLPLAITQAAAYMNENQISLTEYLQLFENTDRDRIELLSAKFHDDTRYEQSQDPVATTWFISFNQIRRADELASRILMFLAYVEPRAVPQSMLPKGESQQQLTRAIGTLRGYKFLDKRGSSEVFDMHSLVHLAIKSWVAANESEKEQSQAAIARLREVFPTAEWENRDVWRQYLPHAIKLLRCPEDNWSDELCELGFGLADASSQHALARAYQANGQIKEAVKLQEHVVAIHKKTLAESHPDRLASQHELAIAYQANGQIKEAVKLQQHVVAIHEKTLAESHPDRLASQHELAIAYRANGQIKEAVKLLEHVAISEKTLAESHPDRLASQHVLAIAYRANGQIKEAVKLLEHVVAIQAQIWAEDDYRLQLSKDLLQRCYER